MAERFQSAGRLLGAIALSFIAAACASTATAPRPFPMPAPPVAAVQPTPLAEEAASEPPAVSTLSSAASLIVRTALDLQGVPYRNGGSDLRGFDCSGFTQYVFAQHGTALPRETREQFTFGTPVPLGDQKAGDLLFFTTTAPGISHVGIALGDDRFVHAPSSRGVVRVESIGLPYWTRRLVGIRRIVAD